MSRIPNEGLKLIEHATRIKIHLHSLNEQNPERGIETSSSMP